MTIEELEHEVFQLPSRERERLALKIFDSIDETDDSMEIDPEIAAELDRIAKYSDEHPETLVPHEEVMRRAREIVRGEA